MSIVCVTLHPAVDKVILVDRLRPNQSVRGEIEMHYGGGKGNNVARALSRLGVPAIATGFQGGERGRQISQSLVDEGLTVDFVYCEQPTRNSLIVHEAETRNTFAIWEPGQAVTAEEAEALLEKVRSLLTPGDFCLLCGSGQTAITASLFGELIRMGHEMNVRCILDSSGDSLAKGIAEKPMMVKINQNELGGYMGKELFHTKDQVGALHLLCEQGIDILALTLGEKGIIATNGHETFKGELIREDVWNIVGCGDSALAGMVKAIAGEMPLREIVRWGVACGTANTQVRGAGFIHREMVEALLPKVVIQQL